MFVHATDAIKMYCLLNHSKVHTERATQPGTVPLRQASSGHSRSISAGQISSYPCPGASSYFQKTPVWGLPDPELSSAPLCFRAGEGRPSFVPEDVFTLIQIISLFFYFSTAVVFQTKESLSI